MTGSKKWMVYEDDNGGDHGVLIDESNGEAFGFVDVSADGGVKEKPAGLKMRYVNAVSGVKRRKFPVGKKDDPSYADETPAPVVIGEETWSISSVRGEKKRRIIAADTGQTDGDDT